jgi:outer membrane protein, heavy metal efflux system
VRLATIKLSIFAWAFIALEITVRGQPPEPIPGPANLLAPPASLPPASIVEVPAAAQTLTLPDLEQIALNNNPSLARAMAVVSERRGAWIQAGLPPNPSWGYLGQQLGSGRQATQHALLVDGEIVTGGKLNLNRAVADQDIVRAEQNLFAQQQRVLTDVRVAFYQALVAQRGLELAQQLVHIAREAQATADKLLRAGETSKVDLLQANIEAFNAEANLNAAVQRHFGAWQTLTAVVGMPQMGPTALHGSLDVTPDPLTWDEALGQLLANSPEISAAVANVERSRAALARARREPIPNVKYQLGVMQDLGIGGKTDGIVQALLPLPIINRNQGGIRQAEAELIAAEHAVEQTQLDLQIRLAPVFERYAGASYRVRQFRESILPAADESLHLVRRGYSAGEFPFLNLLNAQRTYFQTNNLYLQALLDLRVSSAQIEGMLLSNSLGTAP